MATAKEQTALEQALKADKALSSSKDRNNLTNVIENGPPASPPALTANEPFLVVASNTAKSGNTNSSDYNRAYADTFFDSNGSIAPGINRISLGILPDNIGGKEIAKQIEVTTGKFSSTKLTVHLNKNLRPESAIIGYVEYDGARVGLIQKLITVSNA